jgi:hypothetical protein
MDFDVSNILYIVITLVAVIIGLLGKKKKPAQGSVGSLGNSGGSGFMANLERVLNMNEGPMMAEEEPFEEELVVEQSTPAEVDKSYINMKQRPSLIEEYSRIMHRNADGEMDLTETEGEGVTGSMEIVDLDYVPGTDFSELIRNFNAAKAVVYSTIINRLDY